MITLVVPAVPRSKVPKIVALVPVPLMVLLERTLMTPNWFVVVAFVVPGTMMVPLTLMTYGLVLVA